MNHVRFTTALLWVCAACWAAAPLQAVGQKPKFNKVVEFGQKAPDWDGLPAVIGGKEQGGKKGLKDYDQAQVLVVVFLANRCPMSAKYEQRINDLVQAHDARQLAVAAISVGVEEADGLEAMARRAKERGFRFDYLHDRSQKTARDLGALATPQAFVFDQQRRLVYLGAWDDHLDPSQVVRRYVAEAVSATLAGKKVEVRESRPVGCPIDFEE